MLVDGDLAQSCWQRNSFRASYGLNTSNVALAILLGIDAARFHSFKAHGVFMWNQARLLARLVAYCRVAIRRSLFTSSLSGNIRTTVTSTWNPGGRSQSVKSSWSVLVVRHVRSRLLVIWASGASWLMPLVMPAIPLMSGASDQVFYALRCHPSFY